MKRHARSLLGLALALCLCLTLFSLASPGAAAETGIDKVLIQTGNRGTTPVVWMELQYLPTNTSTAGVTIQSATWYTTDNQPVGARFEDQTPVYLVVIVTANEGYVFNESVMSFINGSQASCVRESETQLRITSHTYTPDVWAAEVYKHPTDETVEAGGWASFVTSGGYVQDFEWCLMTPDRQHRFTLKEAREEAKVVSRQPLIPAAFSQVTTDGDFTDKLIMRNIPAELDGYFVYCRLYSYNRVTWANTNPAKITVKQAAPTPAPTPEPTPEPSPEPEDAPHEHEPAEDWSMDERFHWHACQGCDEQLDKAEHDLSWTEKQAPAPDQEGEEEGVCGVCGYKTTRKVPALVPEETEPASVRPRFDPSLGISQDAFRTIVLGIFGAMGVGLIALFIGAIVKGRKRRR